MMADVLEVHGWATDGQDTVYKVIQDYIIWRNFSPKTLEVAGETVDTTVDDATGTMETGDVARRGNWKCSGWKGG